MRTRIPAAAVAIPIAALFLAEAAGAAGCREALEQFERRLNESALASTAPETYANLAREAANAAELRDEELCMQRVAELNEALPADDAGPTPISGTTGKGIDEKIGGTNGQPSSQAPAPAPPAAPLLLDASPADYEAESSSEDPADDNAVD